MCLGLLFHNSDCFRTGLASYSTWDFQFPSLEAGDKAANVAGSGRAQRGIHRHLELHFSPSLVGTWLDKWNRLDVGGLGQRGEPHFSGEAPYAM